LNLENPQRRHDLTPAALLAGLIVLAIGLRFWRLGDWNFQATEMFTLRDSVTPQFRNTRPLGYLLNYYLVKPFLPLDEFGLRLLPAIFGVLAIPAFYLVSRRLLGTRAALLGTLLLTVSHLHVMYSQLARYWSLVFLLSTIYPYALYIGVRERNRRALALGLVTGVLAALAHPVSVLLLGGPALLLVAQLRRERLARLWSHNTVRWTALIVVLVAAAIAWRFIPILEAWISSHDKNPGAAQFLHPSFKQGAKQIFFLLAFFEGLTLPLVLTGVVGIYLLWRERDKTLALFLVSLAVIPIAFLTLITLRTPSSQYYLLPAVPVFFLGAGAFLDRLFEVDWGLRPRWVLPATVVAVVISAGAPTLVSEYLNGRRYDFRGMAHWLEPRLGSGDVVFSDQPVVLAHYLPGTKVQHLLADTTLLSQSLRALHQTGRGEVLWIVAPSVGHTFRTDLKRGGLISWIYDKCQLRNITGRGRVDFRQQYLQTYRCPPAAGSLARPRASGVSTPPP
jgi:4-amino-4-deoxy-L-arabinose transferase-like glycosyltransferase